MTERRGSSAWLVLGALVALGCVGWCVEVVAAYRRHLDTGDRAGASLGLLFLISWLVPAGGTALALGTASAAEHGRRPSVWVAGLLAFCSVSLMAFLALFLWRVAGSWWRDGQAAMLVGFSILLLGAATLVGGRRWALPWLPWAQLGQVGLVAWVLTGILAEGYRNAYVAAQRLPILVQNLVVFGTPGLIWAVTLLASARAMWRTSPARRASAAPGAGGTVEP